MHPVGLRANKNVPSREFEELERLCTVTSSLHVEHGDTWIGVWQNWVNARRCELSLPYRSFESTKMLERIHDVLPHERCSLDLWHTYDPSILELESMTSLDRLSEDEVAELRSMARASGREVSVETNISKLFEDVRIYRERAGRGHEVIGIALHRAFGFRAPRTRSYGRNQA